MPSAARHIERLLLTAPAEDGIARGRVLVEDAFRIASFPGEAERRVLAIRRLDLGVVDPDRSSAALAPVIEAAVRAAAGTAVRFDDPAAPAADVVYFPDAVAAAAAFVERVTAARPIEWFWNIAFEGRTPQGDPEAGVRLALGRLLELPGGAARVAVLVDVLRARGTLERFLGWLQPGDGARMLAAMASAGDGVGDAGGPSERQDEAPPCVTLALRAWRPVLLAWTARWGESDPRSRWLAVVALVSAQPSILAHAELRVLTGRVLRAVRQPLVGTGPPPPSRSRRIPNEPSPRARSEWGTEDQARTRRAGTAGGPKRVAAVGAEESAPQERPDAPESQALEFPEPATTALEFDLHSTTASGLLFLLPLLSRLGIAEVLAKNPVLVETEFPLRLLLFVADRLRVPDEDAMRASLVPAVGGLPPADRFVLGSWLSQVRRAVHRQARMGLRALVIRSGEVAATRTHIDIVLPLRDLDIRVRRAGLDVDPGWVPWLGRVVTFHYETEP